MDRYRRKHWPHFVTDTIDARARLVVLVASTGTGARRCDCRAQRQGRPGTTEDADPELTKPAGGFAVDAREATDTSMTVASVHTAKSEPRMHTRLDHTRKRTPRLQKATAAHGDGRRSSASPRRACRAMAAIAASVCMHAAVAALCVDADRGVQNAVVGEPTATYAVDFDLHPSQRCMDTADVESYYINPTTCFSDPTKGTSTRNGGCNSTTALTSRFATSDCSGPVVSVGSYSLGECKPQSASSYRITYCGGLPPWLQRYTGGYFTPIQFYSEPGCAPQHLTGTETYRPLRCEDDGEFKFHVRRLGDATLSVEQFVDARCGGEARAAHNLTAGQCTYSGILGPIHDDANWVMFVPGKEGPNLDG